MDLGSVLDATKPTIEQILATGGCTVDLRAPSDPQGSATDPDTLTVTSTPAAAYASSVAALVVDSVGASDSLPARPARNRDAAVILASDVDVPARTQVVVVTSRSSGQVGQVYAVRSVRDALGLCQILDVERVRT